MSVPPSPSLSYTYYADDARAGKGGRTKRYAMRVRESYTRIWLRRHLPTARRSGAGGDKTAAKLLRFELYTDFPSTVASLCRVVCTTKLHRS